MFNIPPPQETRSIKFTQEEANQLIDLVNIANKRKGLKVAHYAVYFFDKLSTPFKQKNSEEIAVPRTAHPNSDGWAEVYEMKKTEAEQ